MMKRAPLGKTGMDASVIGLGMEHFHSVPENIAPTFHRALDLGIDYIDLMIWAPQVKDAFAAALRGHRDRVILANHLGAAETKHMYRRSRDVQECEDLFHDWLARLGTDYVDVLLVTYLDAPKDYRKVVEAGGVADLALRLKREGKARAIGFSGHNPKTALRSIEDGWVDVLMHPIGIADAADRERQELLQACASHDIGLVAMKPFAGGQIFQRDKPISPLRCLHYSLSQPGVSVALMGVKNTDELEENLAYLTATDEEKAFAAALKDFQQDMEGICVYCNHCLPCPAEIDIAPIMRILATAEQYGVFDDLRDDYTALPAQASECTACGECEERCPFGVELVASMRKTVELFGW